VLSGECSDESAPPVSSTRDKDLPQSTANGDNVLELDPHVAQSTSTSEICECSSCGSELQSGSSVCALCERKSSIGEKRKASMDCLTIQAKRMKLRSDRNFPNPEVGDTVRVPIPQVDRGKTDAKNLLACILEITDENLFKLGTCNGVLKHLYTRAQFQLSHERFLTVADVPTDTPEISVRTVASAQALGNGQGFVRCHCTTKCNKKVSLP